MKIGIVSNLYPPYVRGGAEHVVVRTVEALTGKGQEVFVFTTKPDDGKGDLAVDLNSTERIYRFFPKNFYYILDDFKHRWLVRLAWHIRDAFCPLRRGHMDAVLEREHTDVMVTHNLKGIGLRIPRTIQRKGIPHIHVVHDLQLIYPSGLLLAGEERKPLHERLAYFVYQQVCKFLFGAPDLVVFPSKFLRDAYVSRGFFRNSEVVVMPNPAPEFTAPVKTGRSAGPLRLLFVGQLESHKGIHTLLEAMKDLPIDARLIIAGEGRERKVVEAIAEEDKRITYLGYIGMDQLVQCLDLADALVVPSLCYENSPTVIYEALQAGVPVLASNIGGVGELLEDGVNGFLFEPNQVEDLRKAILALDEKKEAFGASQKSIRQTVKSYALDSYADQLIEHCQRVIRTQKSE
jgi:glycosyltransferase involved in cell wall biosynthesis